MGLARHNHAPRRVRLKVSAWTSLGVIAALSVASALSCALASSGPAEVAEGERRLSSYPDDAVIDRPYGEASNRWLIILHIVGIGYMLLGLNTVCDVYFCSALDIMVERWHVKPDVAGATFMAAGGSAPELFTSLLGTLVTQDDVGFGTIVGSAIFNVLFVIGLCGWVSKEEIKLTWWPLFRDCSSYMAGLAFLAWVASDEVVKLWEAVMLFSLYILYCILMYNNGRAEALFDVELWRARKAAAETAPAADSSVITTQFVSVKPHQKAELAGKTPQPCLQNAWVEVEEELKRCEAQEHGAAATAQPAQEQQEEVVKTKRSMSVAAAEKPAKTPCKHRASVGGVVDSEVALSGRRRVSRRVDTLMHHAEMLQMEASARRDSRLRGIAGLVTSPVDSVMESDCVEIEEVTEEVVEEQSATVEDVVEESLLDMPTEGLSAKIIWFLSLPIYVPLHFCIPSKEDWYLVTFFASLLWIAGFSFFMVWWVEILGEVLHIPNIVMGYTLLAAGTSIPDAVSSVAVARMGEGDMSVSSSIGSNIFDILVGLPIPWIIKLTADLIAGRTSEVRILSPYLTFFVLLLLFMVFAVILCIHVIGWKLNRCLGACMAVLYAIFLVVCVTVENTNPTWLSF